ncbi:hypothetical protein T484DRAFT_1900224 [Baffinella frigidus]|nr:hypothetical protein T484DRAFT_1900224 [Cryptophyta sp. CCMP2293]
MLISWVELVFLGGVSLVLFGPKDMPKAANMGGQYAGRLMVMVRKARTGMDSFATENELLHLQQDVRRGLMELNSIRGEMQEGFSVMPQMYGTSPLPSAAPRFPQGTSAFPGAHRNPAARSHAFLGWQQRALG